MAHFAELNENNIVERVIVVSNEDTSNSNGVEEESIGISFLHQLFGKNTIWKQTSYNNSFRNKYAGIGDIYREDLDVFVAPSPHPSWILNEKSYTWEAPVVKPDDEKSYIWNEELQNWVLIGDI